MTTNQTSISFQTDSGKKEPPLYDFGVTAPAPGAVTLYDFSVTAPAPDSTTSTENRFIRTAQVMLWLKITGFRPVNMSRDLITFSSGAEYKALLQYATRGRASVEWKGDFRISSVWCGQVEITYIDATQPGSVVVVDDWVPLR